MSTDPTYTDQELDAAEAVVVAAWQRLDPEGYQAHLEEQEYAAFYPQTTNAKENTR